MIDLWSRKATYSSLTMGQCSVISYGNRARYDGRADGNRGIPTTITVLAGYYWGVGGRRITMGEYGVNKDIYLV